MAVKGKVKPAKFDTSDHLVMRFVSLQRETINESARSVSVIVATENPVERYDSQRGYVVREVLDMDGLKFRNSSRQLPIVDSHDRSTVGNVLGSVRNLRVEGDALVGDAYFARDERSQEAFTKLMDGHLTDFSITASPSEIGFVERGKQYTTGRGATIDGPADIVTEWTPTDASLVATGADARSTVRRSYEELNRKVERAMDESLIAALESMGLPAGLSDPNAILAWVVGNMNAVQPAAPEEAAEVEMADTVPADEPPMDEEPADAEVMNMADEAKVIEKALKADSIRRSEIVASCKAVGIEREFADKLCDNATPIDKARVAILGEVARKQKDVGQTVGGDQIRFTGSADDKFESALRDGLLMRTMNRARQDRSIERNGRSFDPFNGQKPADGSQDFANLSLSRMAEEVLRRQGVNTMRLTSRQIALAAMGHEATLRGLRIQREAYHTTGTFSNILLDASNKSLLSGYEEAAYTWSVWARQAPSVPDFKSINRTRFSESPDLEEIPENGDYPEGIMSDSKETYKVAKFGRVFSTTWETIVNDDLDAISRVPQMHGNAARRVQNKKVYQVLTDNAAMGDGVALFHSTHGNHSGGAAAPSATTLNAMFVGMMKQTGLNSSVIIGAVPKFIIGPPSVSAAMIVLATSMSDPAQGGSTAGNSNVQNMYGPGGSRPIQPVIEPQLEAASTTTWYGACDYNQIDTVELTFLQGEESPVIESEWDFDKDGWKSKIRQTFGVKAIDWRGLWTNQA